jgi:hypothetical protein
MSNQDITKTIHGLQAHMRKLMHDQHVDPLGVPCWRYKQTYEQIQKTILALEKIRAELETES